MRVNPILPWLPQSAYVERVRCACAILILLLPVLSGCGNKAAKPAVGNASAEAVADDKALQAAAALEQEHFALELLARRAEDEFIVPLWDRLRASKNPLLVLAELPVPAIALGAFDKEQFHPLKIVRRNFKPGPPLTRAEWSRRMQALDSQGVIFDHSDWHQESFIESAPGAYRSRVRFNIHAFVPEQDMRARIKGLLDIDWSFPDANDPDAAGELVKPVRIALHEASVEQRKGAPAFELELNVPGNPGKSGKRTGTGPLLVWDLTGDGLPEILVGGANKVLVNKGGWSFEPPRPAVEKLPAGAPINAGVIGDFTGDGHDDLLFVSKQRMLIADGDSAGRFRSEPREVPMDVPIRYPTVLTAGDIDRDGDLDAFFGQWREISDKMPDPFWNANDGHGNAMLVNLGDGSFIDATEAVGLADKRYRRTYSASLYDTEGDGDNDLIVVSDFYGVDLYRNNLGTFSDITAEKVDKPQLFGMSHTFADFDLNGVLDAYVLGMGSSTARRLERMGAGPTELAEHNAKRMELGYGNRMYLWKPQGYRQPDFFADVARTGWSWGSAAFDFENDGDADIYVANGNISGRSVRDYCSHFWCKDIYAAELMGGAAFTDQLFTTRAGLDEMSWDGFQPNQFLINQAGKSFSELGFMLDVGFTFDARKVVAADIDRDGRVDLILSRAGGTNGMKHDGALTATPPAVIGLRNVWKSDHHWIGFDSPLPGTMIRITVDGASVIDQVVTGDSFYSQHPGTLHFGLGKLDRVDEVVVQWPNGKSIVIEGPSVDTYHSIPQP